MSDKQGLVSVTMVNKPEQSISRIEREEETATYSVGTTLRTLHMQKNRQKRQENTQNTCNTERKRKVIKVNRLSNYQIK